jgi:hypothetical protein
MIIFIIGYFVITLIIFIQSFIDFTIEFISWVFMIIILAKIFKLISITMTIIMKVHCCFLNYSYLYDSLFIKV